MNFEENEVTMTRGESAESDFEGFMVTWKISMTINWKLVQLEVWAQYQLLISAKCSYGEWKWRWRSHSEQERQKIFDCSKLTTWKSKLVPKLNWDCWKWRIYSILSWFSSRGDCVWDKQLFEKVDLQKGDNASCIQQRVGDMKFTSSVNSTKYTFGLIKTVIRNTEDNCESNFCEQSKSLKSWIFKRIFIISYNHSVYLNWLFIGNKKLLWGEIDFITKKTFFIHLCLYLIHTNWTIEIQFT